MSATETNQTKQLTAKELTRLMIQKAAEKNGGKLGSKRGSETYDARKFRRF